MNHLASHPFDRSGHAALSDLKTGEWRELFGQLEREQARFLQQETAFRSPDYPWPRDPLHEWSRCWEYPYAFHHLRAFRQGWCGNAQPLAVDVGSGVTFFPFALASLGFNVVCTDTDPICRTDLERAVPRVAHAPGQVSFRLIEGDRLPCGDGEAQVVFCLSVLEHVPDFAQTVREIARVLAADARLVLTVDLDLRGDHELGVAPYQRLRAELRRHFDLVHPEVSVHPADLLRTCNSPYRCETPAGLAKALFLLKQNVLKPLLGRKPRPLREFDLATLGLVLAPRIGGKTAAGVSGSGG